MLNIRSRRVLAVVAGILLTASTAITEIQETPEKRGPLIEPKRSEIILNNGENFTLTCKSNREIQFKLQDQAETITHPFEIDRRIVSPNDGDYLVELNLLNVNEHAVGYYACFDNTINASDVLRLNSLKEEPTDNEHISYIYVYVNGSDHLFAPMSEILTMNDNSNLVIGCRPTSPDIKVELTSLQNNKREKAQLLPKIGYLLKTNIKSLYKCHGWRGNETIWKKVDVYRKRQTQTPTIMSASEYFLEGETFSMVCSMEYERNSAITLEWQVPNENLWSRIINDTNEHNITDGKLYNKITIINATKDDAGKYICIMNKITQRQLNKKFIEKPFVNLSYPSFIPQQKTVAEGGLIKFHVLLKSYPPAKLTNLKNSEPIAEDRFNVSLKPNLNTVEFSISNVKLDDTANYTIVASNEYESKNLTYDRRVQAKPSLFMYDYEDKIYVVNSSGDDWVSCNISGYPLPTVSWYFDSFRGDEKEEKTRLTSYDVVYSLYKLTSYLNLSQLNMSGNITCMGVNNNGNATVTKRVILYELRNGFGIKDDADNWFVRGQDVTLTCLASLHEYYNLTWIDETSNAYSNVNLYTNNLSHVAQLNIAAITLTQAGQYTCVGFKHDGGESNNSINIEVEDTSPPRILWPTSDMQDDIYPSQQYEMSCSASGVPRPKIEWFKDRKPIMTNDNITLETIEINKTNIKSNLIIQNMKEAYGGTYQCAATNSLQTEWSNDFYVIVITKSTHKLAYLYYVIAIIFILLVILIIYLIFKIRKEKLFRKELAKAGLLYFKEGVTKSLNPDLGIDEQAELLPYDDRFEFPWEKLALGKQLGSGAFGVVYKAEARGIVNAEETTIVAVKMVKKTADNLSIKALASELKIMVHMGKHINIVNLLGACTKNVGKRELSVIVEYCKFGNIHNYMIKHREVFIDQLTGNMEKSVGKVNRAFSCSSGNSGTHSDYFGSNQTQDTDNTFLNTANSNRSGLRKDTAIQQVELGKVSESGYVQPLWSSNYESDYSYAGCAPRTLNSRDLLCWAFQIARGMEYLASRKVLHGDLAARNILLADDNVVKICDFGLARSIYKTDEYQKKGNSPLPVKWLAVECMTDRIFSTQSDVWSFGIVLWELFTLAKTPYPNISPADLLSWLLDGKRLDKPRYADDRIYEVMMRCWQKKPTARPSFTDLQQTLGTFLEDDVRNHYVDLNTTYMHMNLTRAEGQDDYLAMMRAPDYTNHVTPSPHHYVNDARSFFPPTPTVEQDEQGYLQMSPAHRPPTLNPITQNNKFDFELRMLNARSHEPTAHGSELTPMLTLNNLPTRSGSESDHEGNGTSYLKMYPRIEEETNEVFEPKQNNAKNCSQNRAVTNPTYIAYNEDLEKKPQINSYVNIGNGGLVK